MKNSQIEIWSLENVIIRLIAGDEKTIQRLRDKKIFTHDQYGQEGRAILSFDDNNRIIVTTEEDVV